MPTEKLNCSLVYRRRYNNQSIAFVRPQGWHHYPKSKISAIFKVLTELFSIAQFFIIHLTLPSLLYHTMTENNIYKDKKIDTKKAGFIRPARYFSNIQLSNSRDKG